VRSPPLRDAANPRLGAFRRKPEEVRKGGFRTDQAPGLLRGALACVQPYNTGAQSAPLRENISRVFLRAYTVRPSPSGLPPRRGRLRTPANDGAFHQQPFPVGRPCPAPQPSVAPGPRARQELPWHPCDCAMRAHRVRPSDKAGPRAIPQELRRPACALLIRTRGARRYDKPPIRIILGFRPARPSLFDLTFYIQGMRSARPQRSAGRKARHNMIMEDQSNARQPWGWNPAVEEKPR